MKRIKRKYPIGPQMIPDQGVHFRIWAPDHRKVSLVIENENQSNHLIEMKNERNGYFSLFTAKAHEGTYYSFKLSKASKTYPDPASRYQPFGPLGTSCIVEETYAWTDQKWKGVETQGHIIYEMHIGTFTQEGTFAAAQKELLRLKKLGITLIEIMPVAEFIGNYGWGYDGVNLFAPYHLYGEPHQLKAFINNAHHLKMGVILDVVYNHLGTEGNTLLQYSKDYITKRRTEWGNAINFDREEVREYFLSNVHYWLEEFHFDGLRIDATHAFISPFNFLKEISKEIKKKGKKLTIGENEPQNTNLLKSLQEGGDAGSFHKISLTF